MLPARLTQLYNFRSKMIKELKFKEIIETIIGEINDATNKSGLIHSAGNIKSSGDEVENLVREKISLFLPERYLVKQGHIINSEGKVSNQFDIIIFDRLNTPKFFESKNNTVFYPIESVLAVGEIKKTLRPNDLLDFRKKIKYLKVDMKRVLIENTAYGDKISDKASLFDTVNMSIDRKYKNPLFSFVFSINIEEEGNLKIDTSHKFMPNDIYVLNYGFYVCGKMEDKKLVPEIEDENPDFQSLIEIKKSGVLCLSMLFSQLIRHLNKCYIDPFGISNYMSDKDVYGAKGSEIKVFDIRSKK